MPREWARAVVGAAAVRSLVRLERGRLDTLFGVGITERRGTARPLAYPAARCPVGICGGLVLAFFAAGLYLVLSPLEALDGNPWGSSRSTSCSCT